MKKFELETNRGIETWEVIEEGVEYGYPLYLLQNEKLGSEVAWILASEVKGKLQIVEWNTYETLEERQQRLNEENSKFWNEFRC